MRRLRHLLIALSLAIPFALGARTARADFTYPDHAAPVYAIVSVSESFEYVPQIEGPATGSPTILVRMGMFQGGPMIPESRFFRDAPPSIPLPGDLIFPDLDGNQLTIVGSFETTVPFAQPHMVTPRPNFILSDVQKAFYDASRAGALDALISLPGGEFTSFPTTATIVEAIADYLPEGSTAGAQDIVDAVFSGNMRLRLNDGLVATVAAEDDLFPHLVDSPSLFHAGLSVDEDLNFEVDVCLLVGVAVQQDSINLKKQGRLPVGVFTSDTFDAAEVDGSTIQIGGVFAVQSALEDLDGDGDLDLICHFEVPDLVAAGVLTSTTTHVKLTADLEDGSCIEGTSAVNIKK